MRSLKRLCSLLLAAALLLTCTPYAPFAPLTATATVDGYYTYTILNGEATITDVDTGISGNVIIPSTLGGYPVTTIGDSAFYNCANLMSVTIPDSVTAVGHRAFCYCTGLTNITIPDSVTSIGLNALYNTAWVKSQPDGLVYAGKVAYTYKGSCPSHVTIKEGTLGIADGAFEWCSGLTSVTIPDSVITIGESFYKCTSLTSIVIPDSVTAIGSDAFSYCTGLTSVTIGDSVASIGDYAFTDCSSLSSVTIPDSVTSIGRTAFMGCTGLTSVNIGNSVKTVGRTAFMGCTGLTSVNITDLAAWCAINFGDNDSNPLYYAKKLYLDGQLITNLTVPNSVTTIGTSAFSGSSLSCVTIPDSVTIIGDGAFSDCDNLTEIYFEGSAPEIDINTFEYVNATAFYYPDETWTEDVMQNYGGHITWVATEPEIIESGKCGDNLTWTLNEKGLLTISGTGAMADYDDYGCSTPPWENYGSSIRKVVIEDAVTTIGKYAFACNYKKLVSVEIGDSVTSIGTGAFQSCENLTDLFIGNAVTTIGFSAFAGCASLSTLTMPNSVKKIEHDAFRGCSGLVDVELSTAVTDIESDAFSYCIKLESIVIPDSVTNIWGDAFGYCSALREIHFEGNAPKVDVIYNSSAPTVEIRPFTNVTATAYYYPDTTWTEEVMQSYGGDITWVALEPKAVTGDFTGDNEVTDADVIYLLWYTVFPEDYPINQSGDFTGDGKVTDADVIYLLWHTVFPEDYPIN